jgi:hypothetical protein
MRTAGKAPAGDEVICGEFGREVAVVTDRFVIVMSAIPWAIDAPIL